MMSVSLKKVVLVSTQEAGHKKERESLPYIK